MKLPTTGPFGTEVIHMNPDKTITIMADFGFGPYAWLKDSTDESDLVGINIANLKTGMTVFEISKNLQRDFANWIQRFEQDALDNPNFPWASFHEEGLLLSHRLKEELGDAANVVYVKLSEDPNHETEEKTWIALKGVYRGKDKSRCNV